MRRPLSRPVVRRQRRNADAQTIRAHPCSHRASFGHHLTGMAAPIGSGLAWRSSSRRADVLQRRVGVGGDRLAPTRLQDLAGSLLRRAHPDRACARASNRSDSCCRSTRSWGYPMTVPSNLAWSWRAWGISLSASGRGRAAQRPVVRWAGNRRGEMPPR